MKGSELKNKISEALTPDEAAKVDAMYNKIYKNGMLKDNPLKLSKYDNPDAIGAGKSVKLVQKESKKINEKLDTAIEEVFSEKQRKYMCVMAQPGAKRPKGLSKADAKEMCADTKISKKMNENNLEEEISDATFQKHADKVEDLLRQLISATKEVDKSQDDTEDDVEELDQSIDYLASALTDKDPIDIAVDQATFGRLAKPTKEEINLEKIDAIMEEDELTKSEKNKLKKVSSQLKKSVKAHDRQSKIIDKAISETGGDIAKTNMEKYREGNMKGNRLTELVKAALMGPVDEGNAFAAAVQQAKKDGKKPGDKFTVDGKEYTLKKEHLGEVENQAIPDTSIKKTNQYVKDAPTMAKALLDFYNRVKVGEKLDFSSNQVFKTFIPKLQDLAAKVKTNESFINKTKNLSERIFKELRGNINEMAGEDLELKSLAKKMIPTLKKLGFEVDYSTDTNFKRMDNKGTKHVTLRIQDGMLGAHIPFKAGLDAAKEIQREIQKSLGNNFEYKLTTASQRGLKFYTILIRNK